MKTINIIYEYDKVINKVNEDIKKSNFKLQYFLDLLELKRSFFYKKMKEKRFTNDEMKLLSKHLYPEEYLEYEVSVINELLDKSIKEAESNQTENFDNAINEAKKEYGL